MPDGCRFRVSGSGSERGNAVDAGSTLLATVVGSFRLWVSGSGCRRVASVAGSFLGPITFRILCTVVVDAWCAGVTSPCPFWAVRYLARFWGLVVYGEYAALFWTWGLDSWRLCSTVSMFEGPGSVIPSKFEGLGSMVSAGIGELWSGGVGVGNPMSASVRMRSLSFCTS